MKVYGRLLGGVLLLCGASYAQADIIFTAKVTPDDRRRLEAIVSDRNAPQKHVWRAKIILATADGCGTSEIMRRCSNPEGLGIHIVMDNYAMDNKPAAQPLTEAGVASTQGWPCGRTCSGNWPAAHATVRPSSATAADMSDRLLTEADHSWSQIAIARNSNVVP